MKFYLFGPDLLTPAQLKFLAKERMISVEVYKAITNQRKIETIISKKTTLENQTNSQLSKPPIETSVA